MKWLLQILFGIALAAACGIILLDWQMVWQVERIAANPVRVEELKLLALLMFGLAGLSSLLLFLVPSITAVTLNRQADRVVEMAQAELRAATSEIRGLKELTEELLRERENRRDNGFNGLPRGSRHHADSTMNFVRNGSPGGRQG